MRRMGAGRMRATVTASLENDTAAGEEKPVGLPVGGERDCGWERGKEGDELEEGRAEVIMMARRRREGGGSGRMGVWKKNTVA